MFSSKKKKKNLNIYLFFFEFIDYLFNKLIYKQKIYFIIKI